MPSSPEHDRVLPTCVGMVRDLLIAIERQRSPHVRGDGPVTTAGSHGRLSVLPTCVGMVRMRRARSRLAMPFSPRAWGWSVSRSQHSTIDAFSPRAWGWSAVDRLREHTLRRSPHVRGDGPHLVRLDVDESVQFSPRAWGWSAVQSRQVGARTRSPHVRGDGPHSVLSRRSLRRSPHVRGDGPIIADGHTRHRRFSPRAWGWSVQPQTQTSPGTGSPHVRGDGPSCERIMDDDDRVLPTCVGMVRLALDTVVIASLVLPTCVGMVRGIERIALARRDVLPTCVGMVRADASDTGPRRVLPTCVGMVRHS